MIRKYWWLVVFAITIFLFDALLMQWIEMMSTETDKCRNMNSVNPLKLINCSDLALLLQEAPGKITDLGDQIAISLYMTALSAA
jgi:hypothetical protein